MTYTGEYLQRLLNELRNLPKETEWVEFKHNNADPQEIGEQISALANSAALAGKTRGYLVWGVEDSTHNILVSYKNYFYIISKNILYANRNSLFYKAYMAIETLPNLGHFSDSFE